MAKSFEGILRSILYNRITWRQKQQVFLSQKDWSLKLHLSLCEKLLLHLTYQLHGIVDRNAWQKGCNWKDSLHLLFVISMTRPLSLTWFWLGLLVCLGLGTILKRHSSTLCPLLQKWVQFVTTKPESWVVKGAFHTTFYTISEYDSSATRKMSSRSHFWFLMRM